MVGLPEEDIKIPPFSVIARKNFTGSAVGKCKIFELLAVTNCDVGGGSFIKDMFQFASEHKIESDVDVFPIEKVCTLAHSLAHSRMRSHFRYQKYYDCH